MGNTLREYYKFYFAFNDNGKANKVKGYFSVEYPKRQTLIEYDNESSMRLTNIGFISGACKFNKGAAKNDYSFIMGVNRALPEDTTDTTFSLNILNGELENVPAFCLIKNSKGISGKNTFQDEQKFISYAPRDNWLKGPAGLEYSPIKIKVFEEVTKQEERDIIDGEILNAKNGLNLKYNSFPHNFKSAYSHYKKITKIESTPLIDDKFWNNAFTADINELMPD
ncbi:MAG: hypothetical protein FWD32_01390 [Firmicutes bacterium]|nr:hypothetical protein [Bacillota bacterium]